MKHQVQKLKLLEWGFWPLFFIITDFIGATSVLMEFSRRGQQIDTWRPFVAEYTSGLLIVLLIPIIIWVDGRRPFQKATWKTTALMHLGLSVPFSLLHVGGMVGLRKLVYAAQGVFYDFGNVPVELFYEYRKDIGTYILVLAVLYGYRHFRFRYFEACIETPKNPETPLKRVLIKTGGKETVLKLDSIERLEAAGNYVNVHSLDARHFLRATISQLEGRLPKDKFVRVHRSNIVNLDRIKEIIPTPSGDARIVMESGDHVSLSRRYRDRLKALEI